jgi:hypothetical protein
MTIQFWPNLMGQIVVVLGARYYITKQKGKMKIYHHIFI